MLVEKPRKLNNVFKFLEKENRVSFFSFVAGTLLMVIMTYLLEIERSFLGPVNIALIYLLPVLISGVRWGAVPSVIVAIVGILTFDFLFIPPTYAFAIPGFKYSISFFIFILVGLITGTITTELKKQLTYSRQREAKVNALYVLSRNIAAVSEEETILENIICGISDTIEGKFFLLLPDKNNKLELKAYSKESSDCLLSQNEIDLATWVYEKNQKVGKGIQSEGDNAGLYMPLSTEQGIHGVLVVHPNDIEQVFDPEQQSILEAFAGLSALALNRVMLTEQAREARILVESELLRTALFNSLSHDLRTPLASIVGSVTGLLQGDDLFTPADRKELLINISQGAQRMNRFVNNLLEMAKLESGMLKVNKEWCDIQDIIGVAVESMGDTLGDRPLIINVEPELPLIQVDYMLIEQVLINILDNAQKYSTPESEITISAKSDGKQLEILVESRGQYIPEKDLKKIFDKFYRLKTPLQVSGTGLGLSICKGLIEAHGGKIWAMNKGTDSTIITFVLPLDDDDTTCINA